MLHLPDCEHKHAGTAEQLRTYSYGERNLPRRRGEREVGETRREFFVARN